jgi:hypothetical protein
MRSDIIWVHLPEEGRIDHDPAIDRYLNDFSLIHIKCFALAMTMINTQQGDKLLTTLDKVNPKSPQGQCHYIVSSFDT